jgi:hypothetical protein
MRGMRHTKKPSWATLLILGLVFLRGLVPAGFMPASGRPFSIEICWEGLPGELLAQVERSHADSVGMGSMPMDPMPADSTSHHGAQQGPHHHSGSDHCVFGSCSAGPIPHLPLPSDFSSAQQLRAVAFASIAVAVRVVHLPQPRAPPVRLS